jgi:hypothetical protein
MRYNKTAIENTIEKIFGTEVDDAELSELLQKIIVHLEIIKTAIKDSDYNKMRDCFLRLSVLNSELADIVALQQMIVGSLNAGFESEKQKIYDKKIKGGASASMAYQHSSRMTKEDEALFIRDKSILASMITISESIRMILLGLRHRSNSQLASHAVPALIGLRSTSST